MDMKVRIGHDEFYEVKFPEELPISHLNIVIDKLVKLKKVFGNDLLSQTFKVSKKRPSNYGKTGMTRERFIEAIKIYRNSGLSKQEKDKKLIELCDINFKRFQTSVHYWKKRFNVE